MTNMGNKKRTISGITMGDPSGIGPEIILKSFEKNEIRNSGLVVIGDFSVMQEAYEMLSVKSFKLNPAPKATDWIFSPGILNIYDMDLIRTGELQRGVMNAQSGDAAFQYIRKAVDMVKGGEIDAIATAPLNKEALHLAGHDYPGHTEILASLTSTKDYAMLLYDKKLSVIHVSTHISLLEAITGLRRKRIEKVIELADTWMMKLSGRVPRIAVAGINPHSGENGLFGNEELKQIGPAVRYMKEKGVNVEGPLPPDTVFLLAVNGKYDVVVAMYHDQGHIPLKLLGFNSGVNITVGLPFIRTSVDHGTAFDIAWKGIANEESMAEAIRLSTKLA